MKLIQQLIDASLPVGGLVQSPGPNRKPEFPERETSHIGNIIVVWTTVPTAGQIASASAIVAAYDPTPAVEERLDGAGLRPRLLAALTIRMSSSWAGLSAARKQRVQDIIDAGATTVIGMLS